MRDATDGGFIPTPADITCIPTTVGACQGEWILAPHSDPDARLLYLHGGGYIAGGLDSHRPFVCALAQASNFSCLHIDYRLAPEHPFPAAIEDAIVAYQTIFSTGPSGPKAARKVVVGGDSAGGGLTLSTLLAARDRHLPRAAAGFTLSAYTDCALTGESVKTCVEVDPVIGPRMIPEAVAHYLGGADPRNPLASPLYADPTGLVPLLMQVGDCEILRDDTTRFAKQALAAGVDITLEIWPEMVHGWQLFLGIFPEANEAVARISAFVR